MLVWWRIFFAIAGLWIYRYFSTRHKLPRNVLLQVVGIGGIVAIHWLLFFESAKMASVTVSLVGLSSTAFFTSLLEPIVFKKKLQWAEMILGLIGMIGIYLIFPFNLESASGIGILLSLGAAIAGTVFSTLNGRLTTEYDSVSVTFWQLTGGLALLTVFALLRGNFDPQMLWNLKGINDFGFEIWKSNLISLLVLGIVCTSFTFVLSIWLLRNLSPFTINLTVNLEPVYGILLAVVIFGEGGDFVDKATHELKMNAVVGTLLIIGSVVANALMKRWNRKESNPATILEEGSNTRN